MTFLFFLACAGPPDAEGHIEKVRDPAPVESPAPEPDITTVDDTDTGRPADTDEEEPEPVDTAAPPLDCWVDVLSLEATVCFTWISANVVAPPSVFPGAPSRLVGYGMDSGASCVPTTSPVEAMAAIDLAIVDDTVLLCDNTGGRLMLTGYDLVAGTTSIGVGCENGGALAGHDGGIAIDTPFYYEDRSWRTWPTLADAMAAVPGTPWPELPAEMHHAGSMAAEDAGIFYVYEWPFGTVSAWDLTLDAPAAFVPPAIPKASYLVTGMDVLDGVLYLVETDGIRFDLVTYDPATGTETSRTGIGSVGSDAVYGFACMHP